MASTDELCTAISEGQAALRKAFEGAAAKWEESPGGEEWSPRQCAEHAVGAELSFGSAVASAANQAAIEGKEFSLASAGEAAAALTEAAATTAAVYEALSESDLTAAVPMMENVPGFTADIAGALALVAYHANDHAQQMAAAS